MGWLPTLLTLNVVQTLILSQCILAMPFDDSQAILQATPNLARPGLPVANSTRSFWIDTPGANPLALEGSVGDLTRDADVCIVGAGITGVSAAYHLAKHFGSREDAPAVKARHGEDEAKRTYAIEHYTTSELVKIIKDNKLEDIVDLVASTHVGLLMTESAVQAATADFLAAQAAGVDLRKVDWLSEGEVNATYGTRDPAWTHPGHNLWPLKLVTELYHLARKYNPAQFHLTLHTNTPVTAISNSSSADRRWSLATPRGDVQCSYVIHATNAYAGYLLPHMHGPAGIVPTRGQVIALRASVPAANITTASWGANKGFEYWFPRPADASEEPLIILGGGRDTSGPGLETYVTDDSVVRKEVGETLRKFLPAAFPGKYEEGREPEMEWTGIMGYTKLEAPFVGPVLAPAESRMKSTEFEGQYIAAGYTGHGMPRAFACAEVVAGMVAAEITGSEWHTPEWLPRHFLTNQRP
ncbi:hypothetical protein H0H81_010290 [Sphagnurus paluster]|uniref:FAD dependent oxidoreductase domain-containing protein n=1 Tax=Sphagnurus paluster TaxID=117069 RepID=A0A9P7GNE8_9AGAR|nr:hypothetical protein H0H81_010290 [Sphagnurus paluster]